MCRTGQARALTTTALAIRRAAVRKWGTGEAPIDWRARFRNVSTTFERQTSMAQYIACGSQAHPPDGPGPNLGCNCAVIWAAQAARRLRPAARAGRAQGRGPPVTG